MDRVIYFDYCALVIFSMLLVSTLFRKMTQGKTNRIFLYLVIVGILTTIADIVSVQLDLVGNGYIVGKYTFNTMYLFLHSLLAPIYAIYIIMQTDTLHKFKQSRIQRLFLLVPVVVLLILFAVNGLWHIIFYLDENGVYTRGEAFAFLYFVGFYYTIYGTFHLCKYRNTIATKKFYALLSMFPLTFATAIVQFFFPNLLVEMFANACSLLFISMTIQRPEERIDSDTGLQKLSAYVADVKRAFLNNKPIEIIMINIANYNAIQEMLGYDDTIEIKRMVANKMVALNKKYKLKAEMYYLSSGRFRFVLNGNCEKTEEVANAMNLFMKEVVQLRQMDVNMLSRVCIAKCPEDIGDVDSLLAFGKDLNVKNYSGEVLYASQHYKKEYYDIMKDIDRIIEYALANYKFSVYYQPIYSVKEKRFRSAEALLRLKDDKYGFISPDIFISAAERSGAINRIGEFVLEEVCKFISSDGFNELGLEYIEINLSVIQCMQSSLADQVLDILHKYNVKPSQVNLEITETAASYSQKTMMENLHTLTEAGVQFSLDDFGTGYSNMRRIASLPLYLVKLDKSFTDVEDNPRLMIVLKNTIDMIKAMNMQIVVEGVETEKLVKQFSELQCEYIQGYYYCKPIPQDEFVEFIKKAGTMNN